MIAVTVLGSPVFAPKIKDMRIGERAYVVPWAYNPKTGELNEEFTISSKPGGTVQLPVIKKQDGNYEIDLRHLNYQY